jgi:mRNA interferase MazF
MRRKAPDRGDLIIVDFDPGVGHEQLKRRPALVLSPANFNSVFGVAFVAPVTSRARSNAFELALPAGLPVSGSVLVAQLKSLDWQKRRAKVVGQAPAALLLAAIKIVERIIRPA